jgi:hypothetical protein
MLDVSRFDDALDASPNAAESGSALLPLESSEGMAHRAGPAAEDAFSFYDADAEADEGGSQNCTKSAQSCGEEPTGATGHRLHRRSQAMMKLLSAEFKRDGRTSAPGEASRGTSAGATTFAEVGNRFKSRRQRAIGFFQLLALRGKHDLVDVEQAEAYGTITIRPTQAFEASLARCA